MSGPTGTGTQRSVWFGSVDGGHSFRVVTPCPLAPFPPCPAPNALTGTTAPPGGGDTDINFDRSGKQYFADLAALTCLRTATTADGGRNVYQSVYPAGCSGVPGADRQWLAVYDPAPGLKTTSAYKGPKPLIYLPYNNITSGTQWNKSNRDVDPLPGGPGLTYKAATKGTDSICVPNVSFYAPFGADGYPQIDQVTGKVFQAAGFHNDDGTYSMLLNIGTPDASGDLRFLDYPQNDPCGDKDKLIHIADNLKWPPDTLFSVLSMDSARNLVVVWNLGDSAKNVPPEDRQVFVSAASAANGWTSWTPKVQVSDGLTSTGDYANVFPWIKAGGPGRADAVWYGQDLPVDPSSHSGQKWNVFMSQVVFPVNSAGGITGVAPTQTLTRVTPHPMHYGDVCLLGTGCITAQGNRNLADFFAITIDRSGAAEIVYDDTSNGLVQKPDDCSLPEVADHCGAGVVTIARQSSGIGLFGTAVSGPSNAPVAGLGDPAGDALFPVIGGTNVRGMDILSNQLHLSSDGATLQVMTRVVDLRNPAGTAATITGSTFLQYVTRWQMGNTIYYGEHRGEYADLLRREGAEPRPLLGLRVLPARDPVSRAAVCTRVRRQRPRRVRKHHLSGVTVGRQPLHDHGQRQGRRRRQPDREQPARRGRRLRLRLATSGQHQNERPGRGRQRPARDRRRLLLQLQGGGRERAASDLRRARRQGPGQGSQIRERRLRVRPRRL